nr:Protein of uncharacterised function (DUF539) [Raoultella sp. NCTC 9187]
MDSVFRHLCDFRPGDSGMSLGYLVKRKSLQGSCGGIASLGLEKVCDCPEPCDARKKRLAREAQRKQERIL